MNRAADNTRNDAAGMDNTIRTNSEPYNTTGISARADNTFRTHSESDITTGTLSRAEITNRVQTEQSEEVIEQDKQEETRYKAKILGGTSKANKTKRVHFNIDREIGGQAGTVLDDSDWKFILDHNQSKT